MYQQMCERTKIQIRFILSHKRYGVDIRNRLTDIALHPNIRETTKKLGKKLLLTQLNIKLN